MIENVIRKKNKYTMIEFLNRINANYTTNSIDWFTPGHENDYYEVDVLDIDGMFYQIFYDLFGNLTRYEKERVD